MQREVHQDVHSLSTWAPDDNKKGDRKGMSEIFNRFDHMTWEAMAKYETETVEIKRLEAISEVDMTPLEKAIHVQKIKDAYWRRRMAMRTEDEVRRTSARLDVQRKVFADVI
jgi:hypothetical protein